MKFRRIGILAAAFAVTLVMRLQQRRTRRARNHCPRREFRLEQPRPCSLGDHRRNRHPRRPRRQLLGRGEIRR